MFKYTIIDNESELLANGYQSKKKSSYYYFYLLENGTLISLDMKLLVFNQLPLKFNKCIYFRRAVSDFSLYTV